MILSKSFFEREHSLFLPTLRKKVISKICQLLICCQSFWYIALCEKIAIIQKSSMSHDVLSIVAIAKRHIIVEHALVGDPIRPGSYRWFFRSFARQSKPIRFDLIWILRLWTNGMHTYTDIGLVGISAWRRAPSRGTGSLTYHGTPVPHRTCITTHTRFHTSHRSLSHHVACMPVT